MINSSKTTFTENSWLDNFLSEIAFSEFLNNYKFYLSKINNVEELSKDYHKNLYGLNGCDFLLGGKKVKGKVIKVLNNGQIKVDIESLGIANYSYGDIKILI